MKILFDNICFDVSDTIIPLLPRIMNFKFLQSLSLLFHPAIYALMNCRIFISDPEKQYGQLLQEFKFKCSEKMTNTFVKKSQRNKSLKTLPSKELLKTREVNRNCAQNAKPCIEKLESM